MFWLVLISCGDLHLKRLMCVTAVWSLYLPALLRGRKG